MWEGLHRNAEEAPARRGDAQTHAAEHYRERDGEEKRPDDRRHPPEVARVEPVEPGAPDAGDKGIEAVMPQRLTPAGLGLHPPRRTPGDGASEQVRQHEARVEYHPDRREQARDEDLEQHGERQPREAAVGPRLPPTDPD